MSNRFTGARVRDVGELVDGRFALELWSAGHGWLLCVDVFAPTPVITVEDGELPIHEEAGFVRAAGAALRGKTVTAIRSRPHDRLIRLDFASRSRFGVEDSYAVICELIPRFGNVVLVKANPIASGGSWDVVVAAAKEFGPSKNALRAVEAGSPYEPPPPATGPGKLLDPEQARVLADCSPEGELHVYRREGVLLQAHLVPLSGFADAQHERAASLLDVLSEARSMHAERSQSDRVHKRRRALTRALAERENKLRAELAGVAALLRGHEQRDSLRAQGEAIYAQLHEVPADAREAEKERAAHLFAQYKKAGLAMPHLERRAAQLADALDEVAQLQWEAARVDDEQLEEVIQLIAPEQRGVRRPARTTRRRKPLQYVTPRGSRIFVGRTPLENADVTFRLARADDLWFHVQNQPGAHVILQRDDKAEPPHEDILAAASLAGLHSKAATSAKVTVDYTQRKHVRKRPAAAPGLVFYTHPRTVTVVPGEPGASSGGQGELARDIVNTTKANDPSKGEAQ